MQKENTGVVVRRNVSLTRDEPRLWKSMNMCGSLFVQYKATGNSRSGIPGNSRESRNSKFPPGIPGNFWNSGGNYGEFIGVLSFFPIFIVDYDILLFNLTHCINMCTTHDELTAFWAKPWMTSLTQLTFCVYRVPVGLYILSNIDIKNHWTASEFRKLRSLHEWVRMR